MVIFFCWIAWIWTLVLLLSDVFRRDISGWAKAGWCLFLIVLPFLGVLVYLIAHGKGLTERRVRDAQVSQANFDDYVRNVAADGGSAGEIARAKQLLDSGAINQAEFDQLKAKALAWAFQPFGRVHSDELARTGSMWLVAVSFMTESALTNLRVGNPRFTFIA